MNLKHLIIALVAFIFILLFSYYFSLTPEEIIADTTLEDQDQFVVGEVEDQIIEEVEEDVVIVSDEIPKEEVVYIGWNIFSPKTLKIEEGTRVLWINKDVNVHQIKEVSVDNLFRSPRLEEGDSFAYTFTEAGEYRYIDTINTYISGKIIVEESGLMAITGNVVAFSKSQSNVVTLLLFVALGLTLIYEIEDHKKR